MWLRSETVNVAEPPAAFVSESCWRSLPFESCRLRVSKVAAFFIESPNGDLPFFTLEVALVLYWLTLHATASSYFRLKGGLGHNVILKKD